MSAKAVPLIVDRLWKVTQWLFLYSSGANLARFSRRYEIFPITTWFRTATLGGMIGCNRKEIVNVYVKRSEVQK